MRGESEFVGRGRWGRLKPLPPGERDWCGSYTKGPTGGPRQWCSRCGWNQEMAMPVHPYVCVKCGHHD